MKDIGNGIEPRGDDPFDGKGFALTGLPADLASVERLKRDVVLDGTAGMRSDLLVGRQPEIQTVVVYERDHPPERISKRHHQNEPAMGSSGRQGQYAGGSEHRVRVRHQCTI